MTQQRFIKIHNDILNLDAIALVENDSAILVIHFIGGNSVKYHGDYAKQLKAYLSSVIVCRDITPPATEVTAA